MADDQSENLGSSQGMHGEPALLTQETAIKLTEAINYMIQQLLTFNNLTQPQNPPAPANPVPAPPEHIQ